MSTTDINVLVARADMFVVRYGKGILIATCLLIIALVAMALDGGEK